MKKLFALLLSLALLFSLAACGGGEEKAPSNDDNPPSSSQPQEQNTPDPDEGGKSSEAKYIMTFHKNENSNPSPDTNWTVQYQVFEFGEKYLSSSYDVYEFDSVEDAEAFITHEKETMGTLNELKLDGTTVYKYDDSYNGASLSAVKSMFDESEYTLTEN